MVSRSSAEDRGHGMEHMKNKQQPSSKHKDARHTKIIEEKQRQLETPARAEGTTERENSNVYTT